MGISLGVPNENMDKCLRVLYNNCEPFVDPIIDASQTRADNGDDVSNGMTPYDYVNHSDVDYNESYYYLEYVDGEDESKFIKRIVYIEQVLLTKVLLGICVFGIVGNFVTLVLLFARWRRLKRRSRSRLAPGGAGDRQVGTTDVLSLMALVVSDLLLCLVLLPHTSHVTNQLPSHRELSFRFYYQLLAEAVINTFIMAGTWLTVVMTLNRYLHLCHPMWGLRALGPRCMLVFALVAVLFSVVFNLPRYWTFQIGVCDCAELPHSGRLQPEVDIVFRDNGTEYDGSHLRAGWRYFLDRGPVAKAETFNAVYQWSYFFLGILTPLVTLAYCNAMIVRAVLNSGGRVERQRGGGSGGGGQGERTLITRTLISIVVFYLLLVSPTEMVKFFQSHLLPDRDSHSVAVYNLVVSVLNVLQAVNFACNFIPYLLLDKTCRRLCVSLPGGAAQLRASQRSSTTLNTNWQRGSHLTNGSRHERETTFSRICDVTNA